jgi:uncharacterized small protein (DUF1192 family)
MGVASAILRLERLGGQIAGWSLSRKGSLMAIDEPADVRVGRGQRLTEAVKEDLELFGIEELEERIAALNAEIARVQAQIEKKRSGRAAADALFSGGKN